MLDFLSLLFNWRMWGSVFLAITLAGTHWKVYKLGEASANSEMVQERKANADVVIKAQSELRLKEQQWNTQQIQERNNAIIRESQLRTEASNAHATNDSLRSQLTDTARRFGSLTQGSAVNTGITLTELLNQCSTEYTDLAEKADRHTSDIKTLVNTWPK